MNNEHTLGINHYAGGFEYNFRQPFFISDFNVAEFFGKLFVIYKVFKVAQLGQLSNPAVPDFGAYQAGQGRIGMQQPPARRNAVGDIGKFFRP